MTNFQNFCWRSSFCCPLEHCELTSYSLLANYKTNKYHCRDNLYSLEVCNSLRKSVTGIASTYDVILRKALCREHSSIVRPGHLDVVFPVSPIIEVGFYRHKSNHYVSASIGSFVNVSVMPTLHDHPWRDSYAANGCHFAHPHYPDITITSHTPPALSQRSC